MTLLAFKVRKKSTSVSNGSCRKIASGMESFNKFRIQKKIRAAYMRDIDSFPATTFVHLAPQNSNLSIRKQSPRNFLIKNEKKCSKFTGEHLH